MWALNLGEGLGLKIITWNYQQLDSICSPGTTRECRKRAGLGREREPTWVQGSSIFTNRAKEKQDRLKGIFAFWERKTKASGESGRGRLNLVPCFWELEFNEHWRIDPWIWQLEVSVLIRVGFFERVGVWVGTMSQGLEVPWECLEERLGVGNE